MRTADADGKHRTQAVYGCVTDEFVAGQMRDGACHTDVVSIISMSDCATVPIRERDLYKEIYEEVSARGR